MRPSSPRELCARDSFQASDAPNSLSRLSRLRPAPLPGSAASLPGSGSLHFPGRQGTLCAPAPQGHMPEAAPVAVSKRTTPNPHFSGGVRGHAGGRRAARPARPHLRRGGHCSEGPPRSGRTRRVVRALPPRRASGPLMEGPWRRRAQAWASHGAGVWELSGRPSGRRRHGAWGARAPDGIKARASRTPDKFAPCWSGGGSGFFVLSYSPGDCFPGGCEVG